MNLRHPLSRSPQELVLQDNMLDGTQWFKRLVRECKKLSSHLRFVRVKHGFYRIYWYGGGEPAYVHEVYKWMPYKGYDLDDRDPRFESKKYYEEYEDAAELTLNIKNFVEGYVDSLHTLKKRVRMFKNDKEFHKTAVDAYKNVRVK